MYILPQINHELFTLKNFILGILCLFLIIGALEISLQKYDLLIAICLVISMVVINFIVLRKIKVTLIVYMERVFKKCLILLLNLIGITLVKIATSILLLFVLIQIYIKFIMVLEFTIIGINLIYWILGYISVFIFSFFLHFIVYLLTLNKLEVIPIPIPIKKNIFKYILMNKSLMFLFAISPDYMFAYIFKEVLNDNYDTNSCELRKKNKYYHYYREEKFRCKLIIDRYECEIHEKKRKRKLFILYSNWSNLIVTSYLTIIAVFNLYHEFIPQFFMDTMMIFIILRTLSRVIEIIYAFYSDVVSTSMTHNLEIGERASNLKRGNRISLAIHSYVEVTLLFALIYYLLKIGTKVLNEEYINIILYSFSVSAFNASFIESAYTFVNFIHVIQVGTSMTLIILAIASYLGIKDEMNKYEKADWKKKKYI